MYRGDKQPLVAGEDQSLAPELRCRASGHHNAYAGEVGGVEGDGDALRGLNLGSIGLMDDQVLLTMFSFGTRLNFCTDCLQCRLLDGLGTWVLQFRI